MGAGTSGECSPGDVFKYAVGVPLFQNLIASEKSPPVRGALQSRKYFGISIR
jgi:hypothetical protein